LQPLFFLDKINLTWLQEAGISNPQYTLAFFIWPLISLWIILAYCRTLNIKRAFKRSYRKEGMMIFVPSFGMAIFIVTYYKAVSLYYLSLVFPLVRLNTLFAVIFGGTLFHEKHLYFKAFACVIMILGTFFIVQ